VVPTTGQHPHGFPVALTADGRRKRISSALCARTRRQMSQRLLVSVRGPKEALVAARAGAHIADVEFPASALGTPYPLNISTVRKRLNGTGFRRVAVSTNIGERQITRATACQAALGVATAGADLIKFGLAELTLEAAVYLGRNIVRSVRKWFPDRGLYPAVFVDDEMCRFLDPIEDGPALARAINSDGVLIDTYDKNVGQGLLDYVSIPDIKRFTRALHRQRREAWVAGSITTAEIGELWSAGVDVVCVRGAACEPDRATGRFGKVTEERVRELMSTVPRRRR